MPALTKRRIDAARFEGNGRTPKVLWDATLPGFGLRVHPSGAKAFVVFYRTGAGTKRLITVARYPKHTLDQARREARLLLAAVLAGRDPALERRNLRAEATFAELAESYLEQHARPRKRSVRDDEQRVRDYLLPAWGTLKARAITRVEVARLHRELGRRGAYLANRTRALVSSIYGWAERSGALPEGHPNPARAVRPFREQTRERWLTVDEVRRLLAALDGESTYARAFFMLALLTGCRRGELLAARWADIELERGTLRLPDTKSGRPHVVPLSTAARKLLEALPREVDNPFVFPGAVRGRPLVDISKAWERARDAAGCPDVRVHDLRRTVGSWMAQEGASLHLIGAVLGHSQPATTAIYARLGDQQTRDALERHGRALLEAKNAKAPEHDVQAG